MNTKLMRKIISKGEYLGFDPNKGFIYSLFMEYDNKGRKMYSIFSVKGRDIECLITFAAKKQLKGGR